MSFHIENKAPPPRQEVGFVVKNGYKSQRGFSIDYNPVIDSNVQAELNEYLVKSNFKEKSLLEKGIAFLIFLEIFLYTFLF